MIINEDILKNVDKHGPALPVCTSMSIIIIIVYLTNIHYNIQYTIIMQFKSVISKIMTDQSQHIKLIMSSRSALGILQLSSNLKHRMSLIKGTRHLSFSFVVIVIDTDLELTLLTHVTLYSLQMFMQLRPNIDLRSHFCKLNKCTTSGL